MKLIYDEHKHYIINCTCPEEVKRKHYTMFGESIHSHFCLTNKCLHLFLCA